MIVESKEDDYTLYIQVDNVRLIFDARLAKFVGWYIYV